MTLWTLRLVFLILCALGSWAISQLDPAWARHPVWATVLGLSGGGALILIDYATKSFSLRGLSAITFGLFVGTLISYFIGNSVLFSKVEPQTNLIAQIILFLVCTYLATVISLRGKDEFNLVIPYVKFIRENKPERLVLVDTNVIIDGRIQEVCESGFLDAVLVVPRFILHELQYIADAGEETKRARGRRGLEVLKSLQRNPRIEVKIHDNEVPQIKEVDGKLIHLAQVLPADIVTNDYNLARVAELQHVKVLNLNELAKALRPVVLPGEKLQVRLVKEGREPQQAVGYLDDGTMIVVNRARRLIGQQVECTIERVLQTNAGRMVFAELAGEPEPVTVK
jgi:uncharacterized protein YacL